MEIPYRSKPILREMFHIFGCTPFLRVLVSPWRGRAGILGYHRVVSDKEFSKLTGPYKELSVPESQFKIQMQFLKRNYTVMDLDHLIEHIKSDSNEFAVGVTFDDGYIDNMTRGLPILEELDIPATIYIVTRFPEGDARMWWFDLWDEILERKELSYSEGGRDKVVKCETVQEKYKTYLKMKKNFISYPESLIWTTLSNIKNNQDFRNYIHLVASWGEIESLAEHPLITVGAHSHTHPVLSLCKEKQVWYEMTTCKELLEARIGRIVSHLAYPYGGTIHANAREYKIAKKLKFHSAMTTIPGRITSNDLLSLSRHLPNHRSKGYHLRNKLEGWNNVFGTAA